MKKAKSARREDEKFFWRRYDLTTKLCGIAPYNDFRYSINKVGRLAERILRGEVPNPLARRSPRARAA